MNTIRQIERMEKLHGLILREMTGDSLDLSIKLGVSRRMVNYYLQEFRDYGARIAYSPVRKTYYYLNDFEIIFKFEYKGFLLSIKKYEMILHTLSTIFV